MYGCQYTSYDVDRIKREMIEFLIKTKALCYDQALHQFVDEFIDNEIDKRFYHKEIEER